MQEKKQKLRRWEIVSMAILTPIIFSVATMLLLRPIENVVYYPHRKISTLVAFLVDLGFDVAWIIIMKLWPLENIKVKIVLTLLVLTFSAAILTCFIIIDGLSRAFA